MSQLNTIQALIADDESLARKTIHFSLQEFKNWQVCGECERGDLVVDTVKKTNPDVVFLDIKMPGSNGIEVCNELQQLERTPLVIFVTAFDEHAIEAFELCALDYLLKPYDDERFRKTIQRAETRLNEDLPQSLQISQLKQITHQESAKLETLVVRSVGRIQLVETKQVNWLSTAGNYVELHLDNQIILHRVSLSYLEKHLGDDDFIRVHRTAMVRVSLIVEFLTVAEGQYNVILKNGDKVSVSQSYKDDLLTRLGVE